MNDDDLKQLAAITALNHMFTSGYFSICTIDKIGTMLGKDPKCEAYHILSTLHCVDFNKMPVELRDRVPNLIVECLAIAPTFQFQRLVPTARHVDEPSRVRRGFLSWIV